MQPRIVIDFDGDSDGGGGGGGGASPSRQAPIQQQPQPQQQPQQPPADMLRSIQTMRLALKRLEQQKQQQHVATFAGAGGGALPAPLGASISEAGGVIDKQASLQAQASSGLQAACP